MIIDRLFFKNVEAVYDPKIISFCKAPYYKHPKGCPNWGKRDDCPPNAGHFISIFKPTVSVVISRLDFIEYIDERRLLHPDWTERALRNPRHWQGQLRADLKRFVGEIKREGQVPVFNPEAMGVNLFETCENAGYILEKYPVSFVCMIALLATIHPD